MSVCDSIPTREEDQEGNKGEPYIRLEKPKPGPILDPKPRMQSPAKRDGINPKEWADNGVKPSRGVLKECQAQYRDILTDVRVRQAHPLCEPEAS